MAEDQPSLSIDTDWKKQAQEEKRRLAEEQQKRAAAATPTAPAASAPMATPGGAPGSAAAVGRVGAGARGKRELPPVSFGTLVQSIATQVLYYLGDLASQAGEPSVNLDMAKHQIDTLGMLEEKTANNLNDDERRMVDSALYETRMRYVNVASQYI
jgi:hypothetical protein